MWLLGFCHLCAKKKPNSNTNVVAFSLVPRTLGTLVQNHTTTFFNQTQYSKMGGFSGFECWSTENNERRSLCYFGILVSGIYFTVTALIVTVTARC